MTITNPDASVFLPVSHSTIAPEWDVLYHVLTWMSVVLFLLIVGAAFYFVYKYHRRPGDVEKLSSPTFHSTSLEVFWSFGPLLVCVGLFHWGVRQYMDQRVAPAGSLEVRVRGQKWSWEFEYPGGVITDELHVPVGRPVKLVMTSKDVIHSFFVPAYRVKQDVVPGRYTMLWFQATTEGNEQVFCTEYCGQSHSDMLNHVVAQNDKDFRDWLEAAGNPFSCKKGSEGCACAPGTGGKEECSLSPAKVGETLYTKKVCSTCHSTDGTPRVGPSWKGLYGSQQPLTTGASVTADENYIRESVLVPGAKIVKGYQNQMPSYQGSLKDKEIDAIIAYMKTLK